uniref:DUF1899 domain-containing protein n=1 Tax=Bos mutus grunniens TaxID=30521 RepID=A0A8B9Y6M3_BOSMU
MSQHPQYRSSKFRHIFGKPANKNCYDSVPITHSVPDNHFCAVNPNFIAVVTECTGGGKLDPDYLKVCGHRGNVLDVRWNPFNDFEITSCSEDATTKIWGISKWTSTAPRPRCFPSMTRTPTCSRWWVRERETSATMRSVPTNLT